jgi:hypothetical protein
MRNENMPKIKMRIIYMIIGLCFFSLSLHAGDLGSVDGHALVFEKGDAIYRKGFISNPIVYIYGHAGIFYEWPITEADSHDSSQYATIEILGPGTTVSKNNISKFLSDGPEFWGVYKNANLTYLQRNKIVDTAKSQSGKKYHALWGYKKPGVSFRCDGLVEYCYEQVGIDLVPGDTWSPEIAKFPRRNLMSPLAQKNSPRLVERTSAEVETVELERVLQNGEEIEPDENDIYSVYDRPITDIVTIEVNVSDGDYGSGIRMVDFWVGAPDDTPNIFESNNSGKRIAIDEHKEAVGGIYTVDWDVDDFDEGEYTLHILAYDQAGNRGDISLNITIDIESRVLRVIGNCIDDDFVIKINGETVYQGTHTTACGDYHLTFKNVSADSIVEVYIIDTSCSYVAIRDSLVISWGDSSRTYGYWLEYCVGNPTLQNPNFYLKYSGRADEI